MSATGKQSEAPNDPILEKLWTRVPDVQRAIDSLEMEIRFYLHNGFNPLEYSPRQLQQVLRDVFLRRIEEAVTLKKLEPLNLRLDHVREQIILEALTALGDLSRESWQDADAMLRGAKARRMHRNGRPHAKKKGMRLLRPDVEPQEMDMDPNSVAPTSAQSEEPDTNSMEWQAAERLSQEMEQEYKDSRQ